MRVARRWRSWQTWRSRRVALPGGLAEEPLHVDIRDALMEKIFARGTVDPKQAEWKFT